MYLTTGDLEQDASDHTTANGRPATKADAHDRLARMLCCDRSELTADDAVTLAKFFGNVQQQRITGAMDRVIRRLRTFGRAAGDAPASLEIEQVLIAGSGEFLVRRIVDSHHRLSKSETLPLSSMFGDVTATAACAFAVARLAAERLVG